MFKYSTQNAKQTSEKVGVLDLIEATEGLNNAWMDLTEAQRNLDEVCQVMENIQQSLDLVARFGQSSVPVLNIDRSLENLLGIEEKLITAEKAQEGLGDAVKKTWETFKTWINRIWEILKHTFKQIINYITLWWHKMTGNKSKIEQVKDKIKQTNKDAEANKIFGDTEVGNKTSTEAMYPLDHTSGGVLKCKDYFSLKSEVSMLLKLVFEWTRKATNISKLEETDDLVYERSKFHRDLVLNFNGTKVVSFIGTHNDDNDISNPIRALNYRINTYSGKLKELGWSRDIVENRLAYEGDNEGDVSSHLIGAIQQMDRKMNTIDTFLKGLINHTFEDEDKYLKVVNYGHGIISDIRALIGLLKDLNVAAIKTTAFVCKAHYSLAGKLGLGRISPIRNEHGGYAVYSDKPFISE